MKDEVSVLLEPLRAFLVQLGQFVPRLVLAVAILVAGWLIAKTVRFAVGRGLRAVNFNVLAERAGVDAFLEQSGIGRDTVGILAALAYWLVILAALLVALSGLGMPHATELVARVLLFVPKVAIAVVILVFGAYFGRVVERSLVAYCRRNRIPDSDLLGVLVRYGIVVFVVLIAVDELSIGGDIVKQTFLVLLCGVVLALALAFGLGGQRRAAEFIERWWPGARSDGAGASAAGGEGRQQAGGEHGPERLR